jgi:hypothetical protein
VGDSLAKKPAKRIAPYGKRFIGRRFTRPVFVLAGSEAWERSKQIGPGIPFLVLPPDTSPADLFWPVSGYDVLVHRAGDISKARLKHLLGCLVADGAATVNISGAL